MSVVIKVENLGKQYRLGQVGTGTLSHDINRWWYKIKGKEDPYLKVGQVNDRVVRGGENNLVWALKDINFEVKQGEVLGIIGKNGAGKSTLLKILSKVTSPTVGTVKIKGRIASLLEVGTGFHPDLSGRENIFLNGAILGMTKKEIHSKFDAIVDFSGVERYIDTPVKRYSSGMYVRLAFAVAAHLDPEILVVDEVLAVGDAEFQEKCIGKMKDVSGQGRTILFVSHNMPSIKALCTRGVFLKNGMIEYEGQITETIERYLFKENMLDDTGAIPESASSYNTGEARFKAIELLDEQDQQIDEILYHQPICVRLTFRVFKKIKKGILSVKILTTDGIGVCHTCNLYQNGSSLDFEEGVNSYRVKINNELLPGVYAVTIGIGYETGDTIDYVENILHFTILRIGKDKNDYPYSWIHGFFTPKSEWKKLN